MEVQNPGMQQKLKILNKAGEILVGMLHEAGSNGIVIVCHGFCCSKEHAIIVNTTMALVNEGISVFRFDFTGNGESEGSFQYGNYRKEAEDIRAVTEYFGRAKRKIIAILGHSKGANVVLLYASKYHDVEAVINISGRYYLDRGLELRLGDNFMDIIKNNGFVEFTSKGKVYRATKESMMERINTKMHETCLSIDKRCRVVTIHGSKDTIVYPEEAREFSKVLPNHRLHIIKGANHGFVKHQAELASVIVFCIKELMHRGKTTVV